MLAAEPASRSEDASTTMQPFYYVRQLKVFFSMPAILNRLFMTIFQIIYTGYSQQQPDQTTQMPIFMLFAQLTADQHVTWPTINNRVWIQHILYNQITKGHKMNLINRCRQFRKILSEDCVMTPGAYNGLTARLAVKHGFKALYVSGAAVTASSGVPDIGIRTLNQFCNIIKDVSTFSELPVIADADTGFGEGQMCARTVHDYFYAGASGLHIEDQVFPKRCGHLLGKELISVEDMKKKVSIAKATSLKVSDGQFVVCARTDAKSVEGLEACINRSKAYIDAGADMIFPEGLYTAEQFELVAKQLRKHNPKIFLLANMTEFGQTPYIDVKDFKKFGYNCVIYPVSTLRVAMKAIDEFFVDLKQKGSQKDFVERMQSRKQLYELLNYKPGTEWHFPEFYSNSPKKEGSGEKKAK